VACCCLHPEEDHELACTTLGVDGIVAEEGVSGEGKVKGLALYWFDLHIPWRLTMCQSQRAVHRHCLHGVWTAAAGRPAPPCCPPASPDGKAARRALRILCG